MAISKSCPFTMVIWHLRVGQNVRKRVTGKSINGLLVLPNPVVLDLHYLTQITAWLDSSMVEAQHVGTKMDMTFMAHSILLGKMDWRSIWTRMVILNKS
jgi:hypothetical protein